MVGERWRSRRGLFGRRHPFSSTEPTCLTATRTRCRRVGRCSPGWRRKFRKSVFSTNPVAFLASMTTCCPFSDTDTWLASTANPTRAPFAVLDDEPGSRRSLCPRIPRVARRPGRRRSRARAHEGVEALARDQALRVDRREAGFPCLKHADPRYAGTAFSKDRVGLCGVAFCAENHAQVDALARDLAGHRPPGRGAER